jgi:hypothetical protein
MRPPPLLPHRQVVAGSSSPSLTSFSDVPSPHQRLLRLPPSCRTRRASSLLRPALLHQCGARHTGARKGPRALVLRPAQA